MIKITARQADSAFFGAIPRSEVYKLVYRSPVIGLDNRWDLWTSRDVSHPPVINLRGTTANTVSWLANFYAAMVPATGSIRLDGNGMFDYELASNPRAAVHVGWLIGMAYLSKDILPRIDSLYQLGTRDIIIAGHSQGGALAYLLNSYLRHLQMKGKLPADIQFKTYCSAGPKPGNLFYAYDYETENYGGWACNVVSAADWVPETPMSIQTLNDFSTTNPFVNAKSMIKKQKFPANLAMRHVYNQLRKPALKAQRKYQRYLGKMVSGYVRKNINGYEAPVYVESNDYVRTGNIVVLRPDSTYYAIYPEKADNVFLHHGFSAYLYLAQRLP